MVKINGVKFACERCIRGHRVSACRHMEHELKQVRKKGRPATQNPELPKKSELAYAIDFSQISSLSPEELESLRHNPSVEIYLPSGSASSSERSTRKKATEGFSSSRTTSSVSDSAPLRPPAPSLEPGSVRNSTETPWHSASQTETSATLVGTPNNTRLPSSSHGLNERDCDNSAFSPLKMQERTATNIRFFQEQPAYFSETKEDDCSDDENLPYEVSYQSTMPIAVAPQVYRATGKAHTCEPVEDDSLAGSQVKLSNLY